MLYVVCPGRLVTSGPHSPWFRAVVEIAPGLIRTPRNPGNLGTVQDSAPGSRGTPGIESVPSHPTTETRWSVGGRRWPVELPSWLVRLSSSTRPERTLGATVGQPSTETFQRGLHPAAFHRSISFGRRHHLWSGRERDMRYSRLHSKGTVPRPEYSR